MGEDEGFEFAEGLNRAGLGLRGDRGWRFAGEDDWLLETLDGDEGSGGRIGVDYEEFEGVCSHVDGGEEVWWCGGVRL